MLNPSCSHRKNCRCFDDRNYWRQFVEEAYEEDGLTLERMGEILGTTRMGQCQNVKHALIKVRGLLDERGYKATDFFGE
jgi:hypothetical protein